MGEGEAGRGMQRRDKYRRGLVVETLARVTQSRKVWTGESQQERGGSKVYVILKYMLKYKLFYF